MNDTIHKRRIAFYSLNLVLIFGLCVLSTPNAFAQPTDDPPIHEDSVGYCSDLKKGFNRNVFERLDELSAFPRSQYAAYLHNLSKTNWRNCLHNYIAIRKSIEKVDSDFLQSWVDEDLERNLNHTFKSIDSKALAKMKEIFHTENPFPAVLVYEHLNNLGQRSCGPK